MLALNFSQNTLGQLILTVTSIWGLHYGGHLMLYTSRYLRSGSCFQAHRGSQAFLPSAEPYGQHVMSAKKWTGEEEGYGIYSGEKEFSRFKKSVDLLTIYKSEDRSANLLPQNTPHHNNYEDPLHPETF